MSTDQEHDETTKTDFTYGNILDKCHSYRLLYLFIDANISSILNPSSKRDRKIFRKAFIHSAGILFVLVCGACAILVYRILEPFLHSILWAILIGGFLFPFKYHFASITRYHLRQLDGNSYLLFYGLGIILPIKITDKFIESIGPLCIRKWKQIILIIIFLPSIEFLQSGIVYRFITTIGYDYFVRFERYIHLFDSLWVQTVILAYFFAVLILYNNSAVIKYILKIFSIPIWFCLVIYLTKFLSINYRFIVVNLAVVLLGIGFIIAGKYRLIDQLIQIIAYRIRLFQSSKIITHEYLRCIQTYPNLFSY
jgi:hypothetical protein